MKRNLTPAAETIRVHAPVAAGSTAVTDCLVVDMQGKEAVRFIVPFGTITSTAVTSISAQHADATSSATALSNGADIAGSLVSVADDDDNKLAILEIYQPTKRYVQLRINRAEANAVVESAIAEVFVASGVPVAQHTTVANHKVLNSPDSGTP